MAEHIAKKRIPIFWTVVTLLVVSGLMLVAAQTAAQSGGAESGSAQAATPADPSAVVLELGSKTVSVVGFEKRFNVALRALAAQQGAPLDEATLSQFASLRPNFLDQFATQEVLLQEAQQRGLEVSQADIDQELEAARTSAGENFEQALDAAGYQSEAELRSYIRESLTLQRVVEQIRSNITVNDGAVRTFYDNNTDQFQQPEQVCAQHILLADEAKANEVYEQLQDGGDFAELAAANSTDPGSKDSGGDLGCLGRGQTVPEFEEAAFGAEVGETTEPVQSQFGYHIIRVNEKNLAAATPFAQVSDQVREQLVSQRLGERIAELRDTSGIETFPEVLPQTPPEAPATPPGAAQPVQPGVAQPEGAQPAQPAPAPESEGQ